MTTTRRRLLAASAGLVAAPAIARGADGRRVRMVTSWTRNMLGPGISARRLSERITTLSRRELVVELFGANEIVPSQQVFDAVSAGTVELGHTASLFWGGKMPAAPLFTTAPFGLAPHAHMAWLESGARALWDELYAPHGVKAFIAGNTGPSSGGWFRREIKSVADLRGLRIRATGVGGEVYNALGATALAIPPGDTYAAFERGAIDAVELLAPANDQSSGLDRVAKVLMFPGFNKPNGASELLIGSKLWDTLSEPQRLIIEIACRAEHDQALAEAEVTNARAMSQLEQGGAAIQWFPPDVLEAARRAAHSALERIAGTGPLAGRIVESLEAHRKAAKTWSLVLGSTRTSLT